MIGKIGGIKKAIDKDELIKGSITLIIMLGIFNLLNYFFQISMAKFLGPAEYSIFAVLMSLLYIFSIPSEAIQTVITKYTSKFSARKNDGKIKDLLYRSLKKGTFFAFIIFVIFIPISLVLSHFLNIELGLVLLTAVFIFYSFIIPIVRGILQGKKKFFAMGGNLVIDSLIKLIFGVFLVVIGFKVYGALVGIILGGIIASIVAFMSIKEVLKSKRKRVEYGRVYLYNLPVLIAITSIVLIYSLDVIIARRVFSPEIAGQYAFVSLIAKAILFSSFAIGKAMFPLSSEKFEKKKETKSLFKKSLIITFIAVGFALTVFYFFPEWIVKILSLGDLRYLSASNILFISGLGFSFASLSYVLVLYNLSLNKMKKSSFGLLFFVLLEVVLLVLFNSSLKIFSISLMITNLLMLLYVIGVTKKWSTSQS